MKMVASAKMKGDMLRLENGKHFGTNALDMLFKSDEHLQRKMPAEVAEPRELIIPITSDRGLCGAVNSSVVRLVKKYIAQSNRQKIKIMSIGQKGTQGL